MIYEIKKVFDNELFSQGVIICNDDKLYINTNNIVSIEKYIELELEKVVQTNDSMDVYCLGLIINGTKHPISVITLNESLPKEKRVLDYQKRINIEDSRVEDICSEIIKIMKIENGENLSEKNKKRKSWIGLRCIEENKEFSSLSKAYLWLRKTGKFPGINDFEGSPNDYIKKVEELKKKLRQCADGKIKSYYGYNWEYLNK